MFPSKKLCVFYLWTYCPTRLATILAVSVEFSIRFMYARSYGSCNTSLGQQVDYKRCFLYSLDVAL